MTDKGIDWDKLIGRIFDPQTLADRELMWTAIGFFLFGALVF